MKMKKLAVAVCAGLVAGSPAIAQTKYGASNGLIVSQTQQTIAQESLASETVTWLVKSNGRSVAQVAQLQGANASSDMRATISSINQELDTLEMQIRALGVDVEIAGRTNKLASALIVKGASAEVSKLRSLSSVSDILPVFDAKLTIADSAEYIGAAAIVEAGIVSGEGVRIAILDSGLDYTHAAVGGPGTVEALEEATADLADTPAWPIGNVIGGYDFFNMDPDPFDMNTHGTHVAHSVLGVAPDTQVYAYTVCDRTCPGLAQLMGLEASMDPNGDGDISDRVDVINMSLGGDYGTNRGGAVADLINRAVELGVVVAISAGNDGPRPFIVGGPSTTPNALSVGAMTHPTTESAVVSATVDGNDVAAVAAAFNPEPEFSVTDEVPMVYVEENALGCVPFDVDLTGQTVLMDRGACAFVTKIENAQAAGAAFAVVANNIPGDGPFIMGGTPTTPITINSVMISAESGTAVKEALAGGAVTYAIASELFNQAGAIATFTSRGPSVDGLLKPEITAPGTAIDTALARSGTETAPINGTSFSSPMTAGALSLLTEHFPNRNAFELKATIMNTANLDVTMEPRAVNAEAELAPISYIGAGLVDMQKAAASEVVAWASDTKQAALAFGLVASAGNAAVTKQVTMKNFSSEAKQFNVSVQQRYQNDIDSGAVGFEFPSTVTVPAGQTITFDVTMTLDPSKLPEWTLTGDVLSNPASTSILTEVEYDGALLFTEAGADSHTLQLVYHSLPKALGAATLTTEVTDTGVVRMMTNTGSTTIAPYAIPVTVNSGVDEDQYLDLVTGSVEVLSVGAACPSGFGVFSTFVMRDGILSPNVGGFFVDFDIDGDGTFDYTAQALDDSAFGAGRTPGLMRTFTRPFDVLSGFLSTTFHVSGGKELTLFSCTDWLGLTADDIGATNATVAFRVADSAFSFFPTQAYEPESVATGFAFRPTMADDFPVLVDAEGNEVDALAPGESAMVMNARLGGYIFVDGGSLDATTVPVDGNRAPVIAEQSFSIDENTATGTVVGQLTAMDPDGFTSPVSEYFVSSSSSVALAVSRSGQITVANGDLLDHDAGMESISMEVVAIDTRGNVSAPAEVTVTINNLADEPSEQPAPPPPPPPPPAPRDSGGSMGWIATLLLPLIYFRRRNGK